MLCNHVTKLLQNYLRNNSCPSPLTKIWCSLKVVIHLVGTEIIKKKTFRIPWYAQVVVRIGR